MARDPERDDPDEERDDEEPEEDGPDAEENEEAPVVTGDEDAPPLSDDADERVLYDLPPVIHVPEDARERAEQVLYRALADQVEREARHADSLNEPAVLGYDTAAAVVVALRRAGGLP